jgi:putative addiction module component (TIGR02574 family)
MATATEELKSQLAKLPPADRAELAHYLISTLDEAADADAEAAWDEELARRQREIQCGTAVGEPAASVFARLRARLS